MRTRIVSLAAAGVLMRLDAVAPQVNVALDEKYFAEALPLIGSGGNLGCRVPAPDTLVYKQAENATEQLQALSVAGVVEAGKRAVAGNRKTYAPRLEGYSLGDCFKKLSNKCGTEERWKRETLSSNLVNATQKHEDYVTLMRLMDSFKERHGVPTPPTDALVVHLRLGDDIRASSRTVEQLLVCAGPNTHSHHTQIKSVFELLYDARYAANLSRVVLVGGSHTRLRRNDPSWFYAFAIKAAFEAAGYNVSLQLEPYPDEDFIYMSHASTFDSSVGGYSRFLSLIVKRRGGRVVGRVFGY